MAVAPLWFSGQARTPDTPRSGAIPTHTRALPSRKGGFKHRGNGLVLIFAPEYGTNRAFFQPGEVDRKPVCSHTPGRARG